MMSVTEARAAMLAAIAPLKTETVAVGEAYGRTLAAPVVAARDQPPFSASAMDGYALRADDTPGRLKLVGESSAGRAFGGMLKPGQSVRISTGAPLPEGADSVLIQEDAELHDEWLSALKVERGRHVRSRAIDFMAGQIMIERGAILDAANLALAAACGAAKVDVQRRPRVSILSGGDEIASPGAPLRTEQIYDSCSYAVEALARRWGSDVQRRPLLPDDERAIAAAADYALSTSDLVVFIGAASVGPHDHARTAFEKLGARIRVPKVDMRPGKPTWFASSAQAPVLGLPGNPASALVCSALFLAPILARLQARDGISQTGRAVLVHALSGNGPREAYLRARTWIDDGGQQRIDASADQDSSLLSVFAKSNALLVRAPRAAGAQPGDLVDFLPWP